jgi:hypothetical protein
VAKPAFYSIGTGFISEGNSSQEMKLTFHLHVASRLRIRGALIYSPYTPSWLGHGQLCFYCSCFLTRVGKPFISPPTRYFSEVIWQKHKGRTHQHKTAASI